VHQLRRKKMQNETSYVRAVVLLLMMVFAPGSLLAQNPLEDVLPPDIMPVVVLSGSDYEMGYQSSPSDLELRPFGGDWATWETKVGRSK
jgi:hypothetical protein